MTASTTTREMWKPNELVTAPVLPLKPWTAPTRKAYKPKALDAGTRVSWTYSSQPYWFGEPGKPGSEWMHESIVTRSGVVWSEGPYPTTWFVLQDGERTPVLVKRATKTDKGRTLSREVGALYQTGYSHDHSRRVVQAIDRVREFGIYAVVESTRPVHGNRWNGGYQSSEQKSLRWHLGYQACPAAHGKEWDDGEGYTHDRYAPNTYGMPWTPLTVADALLGKIEAGTLPFCGCITGEPVDVPQPVRCDAVYA